MERTSGYVLHETQDVVIIATGFARKSANPKTGDMIQTFVLYRHLAPVEAVQTGKDRAVCKDCKHRGTRGKRRTCYVRVANAPQQVWRKWKRGGYPTLPVERYPDAFRGRTVRFGSYGELVILPIEKARAIANSATGHTGYSHQWKRPEYAEYKEFLMASVDSPEEQAAAAAAGWRTFRVRSSVNVALASNEITCPASSEGGARTQCFTCRLCNGARGLADARKHIAIVVHGIGARQFKETLVQLKA